MESSYFWLDVIIGLLAVLPFLAVFQLFRYHYRLIGSIRRELMLLVFAAAAVTILMYAGLPSFWGIQFHFNVNLIPFTKFLEEPVDYLWNFLIYLPFGLLLPFLWPYYTDWKRTLLTGSVLALFTELIQLFAYRVANIDSFLMHLAGTVFGFSLYLLLRSTTPYTARKFRRKTKKSDHPTLVLFEPVLYLVICILSSMSLAPYLSNLIWDLIYVYE